MPQPVPATGHDDKTHDKTQQLTPDLAYKRLGIVNIIFYGLPEQPDWVLIDAGLPGTAGAIRHAAEERFGQGAKPRAIILTHGHFDHVGALHELAEVWDVPIYAHRLEHPYLNGTSAYPPPDPSVGGGLMARMSGLYPKGPVDVSQWLRVLPEDGSVPEMAGWRWLHTPGHSPGHVSMWREADRLLVAGDAFVTTQAESAYATAVQKPELHGPPRYYTPDWVAAENSVKKLAGLEPKLTITGHGPALQGATLSQNLYTLAANFKQLAVPEHGRYVDAPARADLHGTRYVPPKPRGSPNAMVAGVLLAGVGGWLIYHARHRERPTSRSYRNKEGVQKPDAPEVERSLTIGRSADELYNLWLEPGTLSQIMRHAAEVEGSGDGISHWQLHLPLGQSLEWDTHIVEERRGELLRWASLTGAALSNEGWVKFRPAPGDLGTVVTLHLDFQPPGGALGSAAAKLFESVPKNLVGKALRCFKSLAETGEIPTLEYNPSGRGSSV